MRQSGALLFAAAIAVACGVPGAFLAAGPAGAQDGAKCPGNPDALGTSREIVVSPEEYSRIGTMQYPRTLPLADKEVVLTFDDGPLPPHTTRILDILAAQCVKVTFFLVGSMAHEFPAMVRREYDEGHSIGTHSERHPLHFERSTGERLQHEIDDGIAHVSEALGDPDHLAPFFRIPGLGRSEANEAALAARSLVVFSVDVVADDWRPISAAEIVKRAVSRLEKRGGGILLLHDIHAKTADALPVLLKELKDRGFHIVHVLPPPPTAVAGAGTAKGLGLASAMPADFVIDDAPPAWPPSNVGVAADDTVLAAPDPQTFAPDYPLAPDRRSADASDGGDQWRDMPPTVVPSGNADLPAPRPQEFGVSLRGQIIIGGESEESGIDVPAHRGIRHAATLHGRLNRLHHVRRHAHYHAHTAGAAGQQPDLLSGVRKLAGVLVPAPAPAPAPARAR